MADTDPKGERVQVANARSQDVGKCVARLGRAVLERLGIREGEPIEIIGQRHTAAIAVPPYPEDEGLEIIRLDGLQRANAGVGSGDFVEVRPAEVKPANRVVLAPAQKNLRLQGSGEALRRTFARRPLVAGDVVSTSVYHRSPAMDRRGFPDDAFRSLFDAPAYGLQEIRLVVVSTSPKGVVQVTPDTEVELLPQYVEPKEARQADVTYDDIGGLGSAIDQVREMVELPLRHPELFQRLGIEPPKGVLLHGPPGTGKTLLAKAVARESNANFIATKSSDLLSKWYGESEQQVSRLFARARQVAPTVIFIDEIDSLAPVRGGWLGEPAVTERVVNTLLSEMDGLEELQGVVVIGATNRPNLLDPALLRPGRFDELIYVPVPDKEGRLRILKIHAANMPLAADVDLDGLAARTEGYTGADLEDLVRRAGLLALRQSLEAQEVTAEHLEQALKETRASVTSDMEREYKEMLQSLKQEGPQRIPIGFVPAA